jgi:hypothetical protein
MLRAREWLSRSMIAVEAPGCVEALIFMVTESGASGPAFGVGARVFLFAQRGTR